MSIEMTLTLLVAAAILVGAVMLRFLARGAVLLFVMVREWVQPAPARHRISTQKGLTVSAHR